MEMRQQIFEICVIPLLGLLTGYIISFIKKKMALAEKGLNNELARKYLKLLTETVVNCVLATKQTYVDDLKGKDAFTEEAQKIAFKKTYDAVLCSLTEEAKQYLAEATTDLPQFITSLIEAQVALHK